jgi:hypothetical protein
MNKIAGQSGSDKLRDKDKKPTRSESLNELLMDRKSNKISKISEIIDWMRFQETKKFDKKNQRETLRKY